MSKLRRRLHHGDVDGRRNEHLEASSSDGLNEPLLGNYSHEDSKKELYSQVNQRNIWDPDQWKKEQLHWTLLFSNLLSQWAVWLANFLLSSGSVLRRFFSSSDGNAGPVILSPLQEERLGALKERLGVPFDGSRVDHQDALKRLWRLAYPDRNIPPLKSELWKDMGWQGTDPSTDFRGGGFISLENLIYFAEHYPIDFQTLLNKTEGDRAEWEYPFAVAGINVSFMLIQMLDLQSSTPSSTPGVRFLELLACDPTAFDTLYCVAFRVMDTQWLAKRASYMEFNEVLKSTRMQLERELVLDDVMDVQDMPSYILLNK